jgi:hypothetical protein
MELEIGQALMVKTLNSTLKYRCTAVIFVIHLQPTESCWGMEEVLRKRAQPLFFYHNIYNDSHFPAFSLRSLWLLRWTKSTMHKTAFFVVERVKLYYPSVHLGCSTGWFIIVRGGQECISPSGPQKFVEIFKLQPKDGDKNTKKII